ncbi:MAG: hypothetical protein HDS75_08055 [Bacteroidales bacterium]|nr:hypothetical protein [Bacteroidales bacterium]
MRISEWLEEIIIYRWIFGEKKKSKVTHKFPTVKSDRNSTPESDFSSVDDWDTKSDDFEDDSFGYIPDEDDDFHDMISEDF